MVYFLQDSGTFEIKIGFQGDDSKTDRPPTLQTGNPRELILLLTIPGDRNTERNLHLRFAEFHVRREWFKPAPALLQFILSHGPNPRRCVFGCLLCDHRNRYHDHVARVKEDFDEYVVTCLDDDEADALDRLDNWDASDLSPEDEILLQQLLRAERAYRRAVHQTLCKLTETANQTKTLAEIREVVRTASNIALDWRHSNGERHPAYLDELLQRVNQRRKATR